MNSSEGHHVCEEWELKGICVCYLGPFAANYGDASAVGGSKPLPHIVIGMCAPQLFLKHIQVVGWHVFG